MTTHPHESKIKWTVSLRYAFVIAAIIVLLVACGADPTTVPTPSALTEDSSAASQATSSSLSALGVVRPASSLTLSFLASGPLTSLDAQVGTTIHRGDLLASIDASALELELESAQQEVVLAQAALSALEQTPDPDEVARLDAQHAADIAEAELALETALSAQVAAEKAHALALAQASADVDRARMAVDNAMESGGEDPSLTIAAVRLEQAQSILADAQEAYDRAWDSARDWETYMTDPTSPYPGAPPSGPSLSKQIEAERLGTERGLASAKANLNIAWAEYSGALASGSDQEYRLHLLETDLALAELQLDDLSSGPDPAPVAAAARAELALERLASWQNPLLEPIPAEEITAARARLRQAELAVERLALNLTGTALIAPFDGVIAAVHGQVGEWVSPGAPVVEIIDTGLWHVETRNVGELTIGQVDLGMEADVRINAFAGETLSGHIVAISPVAVVQQGDTTYTLTIELAVPAGMNLRSGMTARVEIRMA